MTLRDVAAFLSIFLFFAPFAGARTWTDVTGKHKFEAGLVRVSDDNETLSLARAGKEYEIPVAALSEKDQAYVRKLSGSSNRRKLTLKDVPEADLDRMRKDAKELWPGDRQMQIHEMTFAVKDYLREKLRTEKALASGELDGSQTMISKLLARAEQNWPEDTVMQADEVQNQLRAFQEMKQYKSTDLPALAVIQVKHNAKRIYPDDFQAQLNYVHQQVRLGKQYLAKLEVEEREERIAMAKRTGKKEFQYTLKSESDAKEPPPTMVASNTIVYVQSAHCERTTKERRLLDFLRVRGERRYRRESRLRFLALLRGN